MKIIRDVGTQGPAIKNGHRAAVARRARRCTGSRRLMRRDQLEHAICAACQIIDRPEVIVLGSQSILGTFDEAQLPADATISLEADVLPIAADNDETARLADLIEGVVGEFSSFEELHGFSIDGVDTTTSALPDGWRSRLVKVQNANTVAPSGKPQFTGWCLNKEDLCVAKLSAFRGKDQNFVAALLESGLVAPNEISERLPTVPDKYKPAAERALGWIKSWM
ncbi:DUF6036 family nucleotidyltransferase [Nocardia sp. NPDC004860]|uniref:DUF6036 family nucleotidyltransferase n=1 Tax=Nocardia sp. NPDC004860 TaxID=3154557 RepID=UPI0033BF848D